MKKHDDFFEDLSEEVENELEELTGKELENLDKEIEEDLENEIIVEKRKKGKEKEDLSFFEDEKPKKEKNNMKKSNNSNPKNKLLIIIGIIIFALIIGFLLMLKLLKPTINIKGDKEVKLSINSEYVDNGATSKFLGKDVTSKIKTSGKVNTDKVGTYTLTYSVKKGLFKNKVKRVVKVVKDGPIITLEGDKITSICPKAEYEEIGFKAVDKDEKDLTKDVKTVKGKDLITYTVKNSENTQFTITRKLERVDKDAPELKLNGSDHVYVTVGNAYNDQGATANDKCDGELTEKIEKAGNVDSNTLGDYKITYKVKDEAGNEATIERTVTVQKQVVKRSANLGCGEAGVIYLTFDDGPNSTYTPKILEVLKKHGVKATFFVTNNGPSELIKREYEEGHKIALHTASHDYAKIYASDQAYWNDLNAVNATVEKVTGKKSYLVRFPGGSSNTVSKHYSTGIMSRLANDLESKGYSYFDWNVDSRDAEGKGCDAVYSYATGGLSKGNGNVILMHDIKPATACAIDRIVQYGKDNGYTFKTLDASVTCHHKTAN